MENWILKLKNILGDIMPNNHWEFWMRVAEDNHKKTDEIRSEGRFRRQLRTT